MVYRNNGLADKPDDEWSVGEPPSRNGTRRIVPRGEGETPYRGDQFGNPKFDVLGMEFEAGHTSSDDKISWLSGKPKSPTRLREVSGIQWLMEIALEETTDYVDRRRSTADEPLDGYQPETTADYREAHPQRGGSDGGYTLDQKSISLTEEIAKIVTGEGGGIPCGFTGTAQNEGYARNRRWTVYAPGENPYHIAAAVMDKLRELPGSAVSILTLETHQQQT